MPKNIQDIVVTEKRKSIRDIPMPEGRRKTDTGAYNAGPQEPAVESTEPKIMRSRAVPPRAPRRSKRPWGRKKWFFITAVVLVLLFLILSLFSGATLAYTPKSAPLVFENEIYTANKTEEGGLLFSVVKLSGDKGVSVPATGREQVNQKASGTIVVYNNNSASQRLVENTRFETQDGKVYRIQNPITVPAQKSSAGGTLPGSIEVTVYADEPGESHNIGLTDFTVPGLKSTPRYTTVYARSKTAMTGGFVGERASVSAEDLATAKAQLEIELKDELAAQAAAQVPADFILFPMLSTITFEELPQTDGGNSGAVVNMRGNFYGAMFKRSDLASFLASRKTALAPGETVDIPALESLQFSFNGNPPSDLLNSNQINFVVNGGTTLLWKTDEETLKSDLVGRDKSDIPSILENYPSIASAEALIRPFWKGSFPDDASKVSVKRLEVQ